MANEQQAIISAAFRFLRPFYESGDLRQAWPHVDPVLRLCWAQWWLWANRTALMAGGYDLEEVAQAFALEVPEHHLWPRFQHLLVRDFTAVTPLDLSVAAIGASRRPVSSGVEMLYVHRETPGAGVRPNEDSALVIPLVMRFSDARWRALNLGYERIPTPGWPPTLWDNGSQ